MSNLKARKANRVINIVPEKQDEYLAMGYTILDADSKTIKAPEASTAEELKRENIALKKKLTAAENKLAEALKQEGGAPKDSAKETSGAKPEAAKNTNQG